MDSAAALVAVPQWVPGYPAQVGTPPGTCGNQPIEIIRVDRLKSAKRLPFQDTGGQCFTNTTNVKVGNRDPSTSSTITRSSELLHWQWHFAEFKFALFGG
eukprot:3917708-Rhodomonas_salina.4